MRLSAVCVLFILLTACATVFSQPVEEQSKTGRPPATTPKNGDPAGANTGFTPDSWLQFTGGILGALLGGIIAGAAGVYVANHSHKLALADRQATEKAQQHRYRQMLMLELQQNLDMALADHQRIEEQPDDRGLFDWMGSIPCPSWGFTAWGAGAQLAVESLTEQEIAEVQRFYGSLRSISEARVSLAQLVQQSAKWDLLSPVASVARDLEAEVIARGNPIKAS